MVDATNNPSDPKRRYGVLKPSPEYVPPIAEMWLAEAMAEGARKYGPFNWRTKPVEAGTYYSAARRHLALWFAGEDYDPATGIHHLGHAMACCAIVMDAHANNGLIDNRPTDNGALGRAMDLRTRKEGTAPTTSEVMNNIARDLKRMEYEQQVDVNGKVIGLVQQLNEGGK